ncbi:MAG TPA: ECF-type sigma factor [Gemmataceae bacterium]|jgi:DNA-directed RNA polymerase specialized sigma24 family protein|nr:ECF-type sigma factor [Gemmataceae bacterium]
MGSTGSVTYWIERLKAGEPAAAQQLWEGYFDRLVRLARARLAAAPRRAADEEDAALSAFDSFCRGAAEGRFPRLHDRDDLWQLLVLLTARKASNMVRDERRLRRGGGKVWNASALPRRGSPQGPALADVAGREADPEMAAQMAETCRELLGRLGDATLQEIAMWKMEGHTNEEIAAKLGRSVGTVERKLHLIRVIWEAEGKP